MAGEQKVALLLYPSRLLRFLLGFQALLMLLALWASSLSISLQGLLSLLIILLGQQEPYCPDEIKFVGGRWHFREGQQWVPVSFHPLCQCQPGLIVMRFRRKPVSQRLLRLASGWEVLVLLRDSATPAALQHLRMLLRWATITSPIEGEFKDAGRLGE